MDRQTFSMLCEYFNMVHGITVRAIDAFTDRELDFRPKPGMRSPRELIFHVYSQEKILAEAPRTVHCGGGQPLQPGRTRRRSGSPGSGHRGRPADVCPGLSSNRAKHILADVRDAA